MSQIISNKDISIERTELLKTSSSQALELSDSPSVTDTELREDKYTERTVAVDKCSRSNNVSGLQESCVHTTFYKNQNIPGDGPSENSKHLKASSVNCESDGDTESESLLKEVYTKHKDENRIRKAKDFSLNLGMNGKNRLSRAYPVMLEACLENETQTQVKVLDNYGDRTVGGLVKVENERKTLEKSSRRRDDNNKRLESRRKKTDRISEGVRLTADYSLETEQRQARAFVKGRKRQFNTKRKSKRMSLGEEELQRRLIAEFYGTEDGRRNNFQTENTQACNSITSSTESSSHQYLSLGSGARKCNFHSSRGCCNGHMNVSNPHLGDIFHHQLSNRHMINKEQCCPNTLQIVPETRGGPRIHSCNTSNPSNDSAYLQVLNGAGRKSKCCDDSCNKHLFRKASFVLLLINILVVGIATILLLSKTNQNSLVPGESSESTTSKAQKQLNSSLTDLPTKRYTHVMEFSTNSCVDTRIIWNTELETRKIALLNRDSTKIRLQESGIYYVYVLSNQTDFKIKIQDHNGVEKRPVNHESNSFGFAYKKEKDKDSDIFVQGCKDIKLGLLLLP